MLKPILFTVLGLVVLAVAAVVVIALLRPAEFRYARSLTIKAAPEAIYSQIADFRRWPTWSPFERTDEAVARRFTGTDTGVGASYAWEGRKAGAGSMLIKTADPQHGVLIDLHFIKPFEGDNVAEFTFTPASEGTTVTWTMTGDANFIMRCVGVVMNLDSVLGSQFETGLANLKRISEHTT